MRRGIRIRDASNTRGNIGTLPSLGMVFAETLTEILVPSLVLLLVIHVHVHLLGVLLEVCNVVCSVSALEHGVGRLGLLLSLPE